MVIDNHCDRDDFNIKMIVLVCDVQGSLHINVMKISMVVIIIVMTFMKMIK